MQELSRHLHCDYQHHLGMGFAGLYYLKRRLGAAECFLVGRDAAAATCSGRVAVCTLEGLGLAMRSLHFVCRKRCWLEDLAGRDVT